YMGIGSPPRPRTPVTTTGPRFVPSTVRPATPVAGTVGARPPLFTPEELVAFKERVAPLIGVDVGAYKPRQIERRIAALFCRAGVKTLSDFADVLQADPRRLADFVDGLTINVSEFFRNPEKWEELATTVLPALLERHAHLKVWSAGCSMGAELYTLGMVLAEMGALDRVTLIGTDLDRASLVRAEAGLYGAHEVPGVSPERLARYFTPEGNQQRLLAPEIRARSRFYRQDLLSEEPELDCHLILCRNVVIYLNEESKLKLYRQFRRALAPGGVLFVGGTERIFGHRELGFDLLAPFFYQRSEAS
ncbi:MAG: cheR, partial [Cyanobacteria bacterium RYN_339]|nr:cheR [Cyanobacteria bacterium RYN_339]